MCAVFLQNGVFRASSALGWNPCDVFKGIFDITCLAMHAVGEIQFQGGLSRFLVNFHFIHIGRAEPGARILIFLFAGSVADVEIGYLEVCWLLFLMSSAGVVNVGFLIKGHLPIEFNYPFLLVCW